MLKAWKALPDFDPAKLRALGRVRFAEYRGLLVVSLEPDLPLSGRTVRLPPEPFLMEPELARKIARHLIEAADFLEGTGDAN